MNFKEKVLAGQADEETFDDLVDEWHTGDSSLELHEYLGLTWQEYTLLLHPNTKGVKDFARKLNAQR